MSGPRTFKILVSLSQSRLRKRGSVEAALVECIFRFGRFIAFESIGVIERITGVWSVACCNLESSAHASACRLEAVFMNICLCFRLSCGLSKV